MLTSLPYQQVPPGLALLCLPSRSISIFPVIQIWPSAWAGCSAFITMKISVTLILPLLLLISGDDGIYPLVHFLKTTYIFHWEEIENVFTSIFLSSGSLQVCGMARAGISFSGDSISFSSLPLK